MKNVQYEENHFWGLMLTVKMNYHLHCIKSSTQPALPAPSRTKRNNINGHIQSVRKQRMKIKGICSYFFTLHTNNRA